ncbi:MAG: 30S ribosomal protein S21 [Deltaproteobacteria bacterium]|nr:30S ribosomal protein S21 [Deltaproteobacteria bacterium]
MKKDGLAIRVFNGDLHSAIKVFLRKTKQSGVIGELKKHREFVDANTRKRMKSWRAQSRRNKSKAKGRARMKSLKSTPILYENFI